MIARSGIVASTFALGLLARAVTASAQSAPPDAPASVASGAGRALYAAGAAAYAAGNFPAAVQALGQAYELSPRPGVLFSLAQAERQLYTLEHRRSVLQDAIRHYRGYIEQTPQGGRRADAVEVLGELEAESARVVGIDEKADPHKTQTRLMVSTQPTEAAVSIDGVDFQEMPVIVDSTPGPHVVSTRAPGYFDDTRTVTAVEDSLVATEVVLRERPARLRVVAPAGTDVVVDGKAQGLAPLADLELVAGFHRIGLSLAGRVPQLRSITVARGATAIVEVHLATTTQRSVSYGFFAAGGAGIVAGGAAAVVALVLESNAKHVQDDARQGNITQSELDSYNRSIGLRDGWRTAAAVSLGVGAAIAATGAFLYALDHAQARDVTLTSSASPRIRVAGEGLAVSF